MTVQNKKRNHQFNLTIDQFKDLIFQSCYYCNSMPQISSNKQLITRGNINEPPLYYNGIDRIDSNLGYEINNCIPCCGTCNYMKNTMTPKDFLKKIEIIYLNFLQNQEKRTFICDR